MAARLTHVMKPTTSWSTRPLIRSSNNGQYCDGEETCDGLDDCQAGTPPDCSDTVACTDDTCNEATDSCDQTPNDVHCDDSAWCNGAEICDAFLGCQAGTAPDCADAVACTDDICDEVSDSCINAPNNANCMDDALFCTGIEVCDALSDCISTGNPCEEGTLCNELDGTCDPLIQQGVRRE